MTFSAAERALPLDLSTGGDCREMLAIADDVRMILPLDLRDGVVRLVFDGYSSESRLMYLNLPVSAEAVAKMISYYTVKFGAPQKTWKQTMSWSDEKVTVELSMEPAMSAHPERGYLSIYSRGFDPACASHH